MVIPPIPPREQTRESIRKGLEELASAAKLVWVFFRIIEQLYK